QFVEFAKATAGGRPAKLPGMLRLIRLFGLRETVRMLKNVTTARRRTVSSVATETYWSRGAVRWGPTLAVRYLLRPAPDTVPAPPRPGPGAAPEPARCRPGLPVDRGSPPAGRR